MVLPVSICKWAAATSLKRKIWDTWERIIFLPKRDAISFISFPFDSTKILYTFIPLAAAFSVKYSPKGKNVGVQCVVAGENVQVSVKDEGMGIKSQDKERLFERYYRVQSNHTQHISGFGIGLYLCAEIIQRHEGAIWAESKSGVGSTFYFTIPRIV